MDDVVAMQKEIELENNPFGHESKEELIEDEAVAMACALQELETATLVHHTLESLRSGIADVVTSTPICSERIKSLVQTARTSTREDIQAAQREAKKSAEALHPGDDKDCATQVPVVAPMAIQTSCNVALLPVAKRGERDDTDHVWNPNPKRKPNAKGAVIQWNISTYYDFPKFDDANPHLTTQLEQAASKIIMQNYDQLIKEELVRVNAKSKEVTKYNTGTLKVDVRSLVHRWGVYARVCPPMFLKNRNHRS